MFINNTLLEYLDDFCTIYLNNILVFSKTLEDHVIYIIKVLKRLHKDGLYLDIYKCEFYKQEVKYLGVIISVNRLKIDPAKVKTVIN